MSSSGGEDDCATRKCRDPWIFSLQRPCPERIESRFEKENKACFYGGDLSHGPGEQQKNQCHAERSEIDDRQPL